MGKTTVKYPAFSNGAVNINGVNIAKTSRSDNSVNSDFTMSDTQKKIYDSIQNNMSDVLGNLFTISDPQRKQWQNTLDTMQKVGMQNINDIYTPIQTNLRNDIASRFGNLDNSIFLDNLNTVMNNKSKAIADLSNSLMLVQNDLYNQEIQNRMNMLSLLDGLNNSINGNILNFLGLANQNSSLGNQYNQAAYQAALQSQGNSWQNTLAKLGSTALATYGSATGNPAMALAGGMNTYLR